VLSNICADDAKFLALSEKRRPKNKKHLKNVGPIRHCEPFYIAIHQLSLLSHVARRLRIDVHDDDDNNNDNA